LSHAARTGASHGTWPRNDHIIESPPGTPPQAQGPRPHHPLALLAGYELPPPEDEPPPEEVPPPPEEVPPPPEEVPPPEE
jgi:hypothetical protein